MTDMFVLALKTGMRKGEVVALGQGRASIKCGEWIELPPEVTKTNKGRNVPIVNADAHAAAHRIASDLSTTTPRRSSSIGGHWSNASRDDDTFECDTSQRRITYGERTQGANAHRCASLVVIIMCASKM